MPEDCLSKWYALRVRSRHEKTVHAQLMAKQQDAFLPLYSTRRRWADRWKTVSLPLFPGYVFCRLDGARRHTVLATSGVVEVVKVGPEPAPIEDAEIEAVQLIIRSQAEAEPYPGLIKGQRVMMAGGPLAGLAGTLAEIRDRLRFVVCVEILCRSVMVEVNREWIIPLDVSKSAPAGWTFAAGVSEESKGRQVYVTSRGATIEY
jgi:transcription antitermination factor NusG